MPNNSAEFQFPINIYDIKNNILKGFEKPRIETIKVKKDDNIYEIMNKTDDHAVVCFQLNLDI